MTIASVTAHHPKGAFLRVLGVGFGIAVSLGNCIGSGIMRTPGEIAARIPSIPLIMCAWIVGGVYSLAGAWSLAEVGAMFPSAGAYYTIARRAFGDYVGFVVGWTDCVSLCGAMATITILAGEYFGDLVPRLANHNVSFAMSLTVLLAFVQASGIRSSSRLQNVSSAIIALVFFSLIIAAFLLPSHRELTPSAVSMPTGVGLFFAWILVLQAVVVTYDGWYAAIYFGDEMINPGVELPRSMINGVLLVSAIFILINAALLYALDLGSLSHDNLPVAAVGQVIFGSRGALVMRWFMLGALISIANATLLCVPRILCAMSRDGWGSPRIGYINRGGTPTISLALCVLIVLGLLLTGSFDRVLAITAFCYVSKYLLSYVAVFVLRYREPATPRPYRTFGYPYTTGAAVLLSLAFLLGVIFADTRNSLYGALLLIFSYPIYRFVRKNTVGIRPPDQAIATAEIE